MFLDELERQGRRLRDRMIFLVGVLALFGVDSAAQEPGNPAATVISDAPSKPRPVLSAVGRGPLYPEPPPEAIASSSVAPSRVLAIPVTVFSAYLRAADAVALSEPKCRLTWPVLAAIGRVESHHARNGDVTPQGDITHPVFGPVLDGRNGTAAISDHNGHPVRAIGPMQFLPATWEKWASDGNGDGRGDPQNVFDASLAAGRYLCSDSEDLATQTGVHHALRRYNDSEQYADTVMHWIRAYAREEISVPDQPDASAGGFDSDGAETVSYSQSKRAEIAARTEPRPTASTPTPARSSPGGQPSSPEPPKNQETPRPGRPPGLVDTLLQPWTPTTCPPPADCTLLRVPTT